MVERRRYPRIIVALSGITFLSGEDRFDVVNMAEDGFCLRRQGGRRVAPGQPIDGVLQWPEKNVEKNLRGLICWSRSVDDGNMYYGVHADVSDLRDFRQTGEQGP